MRLTLTIRGTDVLALEIRWPSKPKPKRKKKPEPRLQATSGGEFERAETYGDPDCTVGFGFTAGG